MSGHCTVEQLSAYFDQELAGDEYRKVAGHLGGCPECRRELAAFSRVIAQVRRLERAHPPPVLELEVQRRIALADGGSALASGREPSRSGWRLQSATLVSFSLVIAFSVILYLFADAVERQRQQTLPVRWESPVREQALGAEPAPGPGRELVESPQIWLEVGVDPAAPRQRVEVGSPTWEGLVSAYPELAELTGRTKPVVVRVGDEVVELHDPAGAL